MNIVHQSSQQEEEDDDEHAGHAQMMNDEPEFWSLVGVLAAECVWCLDLLWCDLFWSWLARLTVDQTLVNMQGAADNAAEVNWKEIKS